MNDNDNKGFVPLSEQIRAANLDVWDTMQAHRFVTDIEADRLSDEAFKAYLVYECDFVETAMLIFGHMLVKAPSLAERRWLAGVLQALATEQIGYFEATFKAVGVTGEDRAKPLPSSVFAFRDGMLAIARDGDYLDGVAIMLAAEWMYATWCSRAAGKPITNPVLKRWVDLHAEPEFLAQADWLRRQIDAAGPAEADRLGQRFRKALELEIAFHSAPFEGDES
ncbi:TenA family transcriptional regulator [Kaistia algarum]|uniref:TenA family protein n=1 Tax=Kaistia algarum TaxID=2083279 RepID=UPI000CE72859|nr:TenA family protein [Kaistia algarum]MCX5514956.1 TenA family protein [Kaistia algarum]PPE79701.1 TenA family transcriptional regulator [Kaistia algarum]